MFYRLITLDDDQNLAVQIKCAPACLRLASSLWQLLHLARSIFSVLTLT